MSNSNQHARERQRLDFAKIQGSIQIPNLIEVQMKSYQRFLQMDLLPSEREDAGLQSVFTSVFPIRDFREMSQLEFVDYSIGNWECKCGNLKGLHHLRATCRNCGASVVTNPYQTGDVICHKCGTFNKNTPTFCNKCGDPVAMQLKYDVNECQERGMTYSAPLKVTIRLTIYDKARAFSLKAPTTAPTSSAKSFLTAGRGLNSNTTPRIFSMSASTASASSLAPSSFAPLG